MRESDLHRAIMIAASAAGHRMWRNNTGATQNADGQWIRYGVGGVGGSDLIGGTRTGRIAAIEVKLPRKRPTEEQAAFLAVVAGLGGVAGVAHSVEEALAILNG